MKNVRIWFKKTGSVKYISHLDLMRCMGRALKLSKLPVWYTEGFNPHIYMTYAMPLSLGVSGERECMDIRLNEDVPFDEVIERLNACLPPDIRALEAAEPVEKTDAVQFSEYEIFLETENSAELKKLIKDIMSRETVTVIKHGKKGDKELDIKPHFENMELDSSAPRSLRLHCILPCSVAGSVNPSLLLDALKQYGGAEPYAEITRKNLLTKNFSPLK